MTVDDETGLFYFQRDPDYRSHQSERRVSFEPLPPPKERPKTPGAADETDWKKLFHCTETICGEAMHIRAYDASPIYTFETDLAPTGDKITDLRFPFLAFKSQHVRTGEKGLVVVTPPFLWEMVGGLFCSLLTKKERKRLARRVLPLLRLEYDRAGRHELAVAPYYTGRGLDVALARRSMTQQATRSSIIEKQEQNKLLFRMASAPNPT